MTKNVKKISRREFLKLLGIAGVSVVGTGYVGLQYGVKIEAKSLSVERVTIPIIGKQSVPDGYRVVFMSDFHYYPHTQLDLVKESVTLANSLKPDLILLGGDYVDTESEPIFELAPALAQLNARQGVFAVLGNHDYRLNQLLIQQGLLESGIEILKNEGLLLTSGADRLYLAGLDDPWLGRADLKEALEKMPSGIASLILAHEPDFADATARNEQATVRLSGHSHGGQIRLPGIGALVLPPFGEKYDQGLYKVGHLWQYTTRGIGVKFPPLRINCPPEVTEITLVRG
jgi:predicted MPP superfamily phosphohydrolase